MKNPELHSRLQEFVFDLPGTELPLVARLARENGWTRRYADRVLAEYRRFVYLGATCGHPVTPSDEVDQAWHLHMLYTESYWERMCGEVLGFAFHHGPTRGGKAEGAKFNDWYVATLEAYRREFGSEPPADIWPTASQRFSMRNSYVRVNLADNIVLSRPRLRRYGLGALAGTSVLVAFGCTPLLQTPWFAEASGSGVKEILILGAVILAIIVGVTYVMRTGMKGGRCSSGCSASSPGTDSGSSSDGPGDSAGCGGGSDGGGADGGGSGCGSGCGGGSD